MRRRAKTETETKKKVDEYAFKEIKERLYDYREIMLIEQNEIRLQKEKSNAAINNFMNVLNNYIDTRMKYKNRKTIMDPIFESEQVSVAEERLKAEIKKIYRTK